jgi:hypothetical protein
LVFAVARHALADMGGACRRLCGVPNSVNSFARLRFRERRRARSTVARAEKQMSYGLWIFFQWLIIALMCTLAYKDGGIKSALFVFVVVVLFRIAMLRIAPKL